MLVKLPEGASVTAAAQAFEDDPTVEFAEPNNISHLTATLPNDPRFGDLWGLNQAADHDIDAPEAWDLNTGSGSVIVAVIDSGVSYTHPDLAPNIWINDDPAGGGDNDGNGKVDDTRGWDFVQEDNTPLDFNGHGTHVAGTIGAQGNNSAGITGVNWDVSIMPLRAADAFGGLTDADIAQAITYACANGADVVNGSFGGPAAEHRRLERDQVGRLREHALRLRRRERRRQPRAQRSPTTTRSRASTTARPPRAASARRTSSAWPPRQENGTLAELLEPRRHGRPPGRARDRHLERPAGLLDAARMARRLRGHDGRVQLALERPPHHLGLEALEPVRDQEVRNVQPGRLAERRLQQQHADLDPPDDEVQPGGQARLPSLLRHAPRHRAGRGRLPDQRRPDDLRLDRPRRLVGLDRRRRSSPSRATSRPSTAAPASRSASGSSATRRSRGTGSTSTTSACAASPPPAARTSRSTAPRWRRRTSPAPPRCCWRATPGCRSPRSRPRSSTPSTRRPDLEVLTNGRLQLFGALGSVADGAPPEGYYQSRPPARTNQTTATLAFSSNEPGGDTFVCSHDGGAYAPCTSPDGAARSRRRQPHVLGGRPRRAHEPGREPGRPPTG